MAKKKKKKQKEPTEECVKDECNDCDQKEVCDQASKIRIMMCGRCGCGVLEVYKDEDDVLYCDCARCGAGVAKFHAQQFFSEPSGLEEMKAKGNC
jgi:hypothetical protein